MIDQESKIAAAKIGIGTAGAAASALTLNEWVAIITITYLILQIGLLVPKYVQIARDWLKRKKENL